MASWASEVGRLREELSEIEEIYSHISQNVDDFTRLVDEVDDRSSFDETDPEEKKLMKKGKYFLALGGVKHLGIAETLIQNVENLIRLHTKSPKPSSRKSFKRYDWSETGSIEEFATNLATLSVQIRNVGQSLSGFSRIDLVAVQEGMEQASERARRAYVVAEKLI